MRISTIIDPGMAAPPAVPEVTKGVISAEAPDFAAVLMAISSPTLALPEKGGVGPVLLAQAPVPDEGRAVAQLATDVPQTAEAEGSGAPSTTIATAPGPKFPLEKTDFRPETPDFAADPVLVDVHTAQDTFSVVPEMSDMIEPVAAPVEPAKTLEPSDMIELPEVAPIQIALPGPDMPKSDGPSLPTPQPTEDAQSSRPIVGDAKQFSENGLQPLELSRDPLPDKMTKTEDRVDQLALPLKGQSNAAPLGRPTMPDSSLATLSDTQIGEALTEPKAPSKAVPDPAAPVAPATERAVLQTTKTDQPQPPASAPSFAPAGVDQPGQQTAGSVAQPSVQMPADDGEVAPPPLPQTAIRDGQVAMPSAAAPAPKPELVHRPPEDAPPRQAMPVEGHKASAEMARPEATKPAADTPPITPIPDDGQMDLRAAPQASAVTPSAAEPPDPARAFDTAKPPMDQLPALDSAQDLLRTSQADPLVGLTSEAKSLDMPEMPAISRADPGPRAAQQVAVALAMNPEGGFELALDPEELGSVRLNLSPSDNGMIVQVTAERPETMDLLRRHIDVLARELREAGYSDVSFSFGSDTPSHQGRDAERGYHANGAAPVDTADGPVTTPTHTPTPRIAASSGLDLRL